MACDRSENIMQRLLRFVSLAAFILTFTAPAAAQAQTYPNKPVRIIVPFGAGGPGDTLGRLLAQHLSEQLKQPFVVEARPGAAAMIGSDAVAKSPPDGYTLLMVSNAHTTNESLIPNRPFQLMRDFVTVSAINYSDVVLTVHPSIEAKTLAEFIALAKSKPGQINYASSGIGTVYHMAGELLKTMSVIDIVHVPHKASGDMRSSVMAVMYR
jgi:tripartite-type tricarboxylate transporter receptor subunit TctC